MFTDKLKRTERILLNYQNNEQALKDENALSANLAGINGILQEISKQMELCQEAGKKLVPEAGMNSAGRQALRTQLTQLQQDIDDGLDLTESIKKLRSVSKEFVEAENKKWENSIGSKASSTITLLSQLSEFSENPDNARSIMIRLKANSSQYPKEAKLIDEYVKTLQNAENVIHQIGGTPEIVAFTKKVTSKEATLLDLNSDVINWIKEHNLEKKLRITL